MRFLDKLGIGLVLSAIFVFLLMISLIVLVTIRLIDNMKVRLADVRCVWDEFFQIGLFLKM